MPWQEPSGQEPSEFAKMMGIGVGRDGGSEGSLKCRAQMRHRLLQGSCVIIVRMGCCEPCA